MNDTSATGITNKEFDYVIAGGGTAGLTLAARLSEDPSISVAVLEAGHAHIDDPNIVLLAQIGKTFGNPDYDWSFPVVKQPYSNDRTFFWSRGKGLGGSSCMNFYCWVKPPAPDMDAVEKLGNPGWGWDSYAKYSKRSESFHQPTEEQVAIYPHTFVAENRGSAGPIQTCFPRMSHTIDEPFQKAMRKMGVKAIEDPNGGDISGSWIASANIDPETHGRSYATTAYYLKNKDRQNLTVLPEATVTRVLFSDRKSPEDNLIATGLEFRREAEPSQVYVVHARKEVILSTGAIKDPQLLELSGIGRKDVLDRLGIDVKIELPGVGENVQEHTFFGVSYELNDKVQHETLDLMKDPVFAAEQLKLHADGKGMHGAGITSLAYMPLSVANPDEASSLIAKADHIVKEQKASGKLPPGLVDQLDLQMQALRDDSVPDVELLVFPATPEAGKQYVSLSLVLNHPLSRGTIHAASADPMAPPEIDPHYFENDFDLEMLVQHVKFARAMAKVEPWKSTLTREMDPGPQCTTDEEIREYIKNNHGTCWHTVGSCSMLPREKQGVVDPQLKVYGTQNLRIVDISILPLHVATHTQSLAYAIGEKAADIIRGIQ